MFERTHIAAVLCAALTAGIIATGTAHADPTPEDILVAFVHAHGIPGSRNQIINASQTVCSMLRADQTDPTDLVTVVMLADPQITSREQAAGLAGAGVRTFCQDQAVKVHDSGGS